MVDQYGRTINYMRISVTDRCNLRCIYCMPPDGVESIPHNEILTYEEIMQVVTAASSIGIDKIKITGGEPLVRKNITELIDRIKRVKGIHKVTLTTNGVLFDQYAETLAETGLDSVNFSLDCLDAAAYYKITRVDAFKKVMQAIELALKIGLQTKVNCVPIFSYNDVDLTAMAKLAKKYPIDVRFIELMPIGLGKEFLPLKNGDVLHQLIREYGQPRPSSFVHGNGPASYYDFPDFKGSIGLISANTGEFCGACNRVRLTSDGKLKMCLCNQTNLDIKSLLRGGISETELMETMKSAIACKPKRHHLSDPNDSTTENKNMVQIGG